jgi:malonate-semialdehyde dehydrogenase (acetylating)/methylmalonate-semialdehyde dehydrogenase
VKAISFVGSTPIAEYIYAEANKRGKRVQALGGPRTTPWCCRMPTGQHRQRADGRGLWSCGERCMAISVVVAVGDQVADKLVES